MWRRTIDMVTNPTSRTSLVLHVTNTCTIMHMRAHQPHQHNGRSPLGTLHSPPFSASRSWNNSETGSERQRQRERVREMDVGDQLQPHGAPRNAPRNAPQIQSEAMASQAVPPVSPMTQSTRVPSQMSTPAMQTTEGMQHPNYLLRSYAAAVRQLRAQVRTTTVKQKRLVFRVMCAHEHHPNRCDWFVPDVRATTGEFSFFHVAPLE